MYVPPNYATLEFRLSVRGRFRMSANRLSSSFSFSLFTVALTKICAADALGEHHTHICISALCQRGTSVMWEKGYPVNVHLCYDPQRSGLAGQRLRQKKGLKLHVCKKCHRRAKDCMGGASCRAPACSNTSRKSCQHLH